MASNPFDQFDDVPEFAQEPVRFGTVDPAKAFAGPAAQVGLQRDQVGLQRDALGIEKDRVALQTAPFDARKAAADARSAELAVQKAEKELGTSTNPNDPKFKAAVAALLEAERIYADTIQGGLPNPLWGRVAPLTAGNSAFNTAGAGLADIGNAAFRVPGVGSQSDADAARFAAANQVAPSDTDAAIEAKFRTMRTRLQANGVALPAAAYGSQGVDRTAMPVVAPASSGQMALTRGDSVTAPDPTKAGVAARLSDMLRSGAGNAAIRAYANSVGADPASVAAALDFRRRNPTYRGAYNTKDLELTSTPMTGVRQAINLAGQSPIGAGIVAAADATTAGTLDNLTANPALARAGMAGLREQNPGASLTGTILGGVGAAAGLEMGMGALGARAGAGVIGNVLRSPLAADAAFGAATGAGSTDDGSRIVGALTGAGAGIAGGMLGRGLTRASSRALRGVQNADVGYLRGKGVPLTVGQALGGTVKRVEDRLTGIPFVGDMVNARRLEGIEGFNRAAFADALAPIGPTTNKVIGEQGVEAAKSSVSDAYGRALDNVQVNADAPFVSDMRGAFAAGRALPDPMASNIDYTLNTRVGNSFDANGGLSGRDFQQSIRGLRRDAKSMEQLPYGYDFGQVTRQGEAGLEGLLQRQSPDTLPAYQAANEAYRNVGVVQDAVNRGRNGARVGQPGLFAPSQLADAAAANAKRFGGGQGTTRQPLFELSRAGQNVLPSSIPDSGTAGRLMVQGGLGLGALGGAGAGAGYVGGDTQTGAVGAVSMAGLLALAGTKAGQKQLVRILADRPDVLRQLGVSVGQQSRRVGMLGSAAGVAALPRP